MCDVMKEGTLYVVEEPSMVAVGSGGRRGKMECAVAEWVMSESVVQHSIREYTAEWRSMEGIVWETWERQCTLE